MESMDSIFDENIFSSVPKPSQRSLINRTEDIGGSVVPEEVTEEVVDDPETFDEEMKSQDVAFWKEAINDEIDSIMGNNTRMLLDLPPGTRGVDVHLTVEIVGVVPIEGFFWFCASRDGNSSIDAPNPNSFNEPLNYSIDHQPQSIQEDLNQQRMDDVLKTVKSLVEMLCQQEQTANLSTLTPEPSHNVNSICYIRMTEESTIPLNEIISQIPPSIAITPVLPTMESEDPLIMGDENLSTILEKESDEFINSSVKDLFPIPSESEDTSNNDSECDLPFCNDPPPFDVLGENFVTFSNILFDSSEDFTSSDNESLSDKDVPEDKVKIYSNPLFKFDEEYISSDVNPLFDEVLEDIKRGEIDEIDAFLDMDISIDIENGYHDSEGDIIYLESLLVDDTILNLPPEVFLDHDPNNLKDEPDNEDLKSMVKDCPDFEDSRARGFVHRHSSFNH
ncbi:hypothetical protein Tco_1091823 [Tanacetum coccineum]|uniref:Uncharacterized protein n=1 Tax=Tanacetum coccineum TaxID=301880 RepID=A0ABQ5I854_9ASTR